MNTVTIRFDQLPQVESKLATLVERKMASCVLVVASKSRALARRRFYGVPSLPGEPPRRRTGALEGSIHGEVVRDGSIIRGLVIADANRDGFFYPRLLEWGGERTKARPFLRPALQFSMPAIERIFSGGNR